MLSSSSKNCFALLCDWPHAKAAENETIKRISSAAKSLNKNVLVINRKGDVIDLENDIHASDRIITNDDVDFVINLHFTSPRVYDGFSYLLLWNPLKFLHDWNYERYAASMASNHDSISCGSSFADECFYRYSFCQGYQHLFPQIRLNHTNSGPYFDFYDGRSGVFYCGIGWDKNNANPQQRFHDVFTILDKKSVLKIYGPKKLGKSEPWKNFASYQGEIAFDGTSLFKTISQSLLGLAISHSAHLETEIATSRIFEIIAGGALPLCDNISFIKKNFGDRVLYIDGKTPEEKASSILQHHEWALNNKPAVKTMVEDLQNLMKEKFDLAVQLKKLYEQHFVRRKEIEEMYFARSEKMRVNMIYFLNRREDDLSTLIRSFKAQSYGNKSLFILSIFSDFDYSSLEKEGINYHLLKSDNVSDETQFGQMLQSARNQLPSGENERYMVFTKNSLMFYDHLTSLVRVLEDDGEVEVADFLAARLLGSGETSDAILIDDELLIKKGGAILCKPFLLRDLTPFFILNSLSLNHFTVVILAFFKKKKNTKRTTSAETPLVTKLTSKKLVNYNDLSLFCDVILLNRDIPNILEYDLKVTKNDIYKIMKKMSVFKPLMCVRKFILKIRNSIRGIVR